MTNGDGFPFSYLKQMSLFIIYIYTFIYLCAFIYMFMYVYSVRKDSSKNICKAYKEKRIEEVFQIQIFKEKPTEK